MLDGVNLLLPRILALASVTAFLACHTLTPTQTAGVNAVVGAGCALAEAAPLPDVLKPFAPLEPVACAGLESLLAAELTKVATPADAGAGLGVASAAMTVAGPKPALRVILHDGQVCGLARVAVAP